MFQIAAAIILSYFAGSFPTAIIAGKIVLKDDIRNYGSKNAGATNVFRVMGWKPALAVLLIDIGKGAAAVLFISRIGIGSSVVNADLIKILAGMAAICGHIWTMFAGFKGGKGVGTAFGALLALTPIPSLIAFGVWLIIVLLVRIVSLGSIAAGITIPAVLSIQKYVLYKDVSNPLLILGFVLGLLILITHRTNIKRLIKGTENKFGNRKAAEPKGVK
ncbi:glycerol-3-phosphate 1-O-acyltransferase PlsY [bacterium]|nr:glycerol-3-phosphate 1-O-acyltransferase PlsY [bacterium]